MKNLKGEKMKKYDVLYFCPACGSKYYGCSDNKTCCYCDCESLVITEKEEKK